MQAHSNSAMWLVAENRFDEALTYAAAALKSPNVLSGLDYDTSGRAYLALGQYAKAGNSFDNAIARGYDGSLHRRMAVEAAQGNFAGASKLEQKLRNSDRYAYFERVSFAVDSARWNDAVRYAQAALQLVGSTTEFDARNFPMQLGVTKWLSGDVAGAREQALVAVDRSLKSLGKEFDSDAVDDASIALAASLFALRLGDDSPAKRTLAVLEDKHSLMQVQSLKELSIVVRAELLRREGRPMESVALLRPLLAGNEHYQTRQALLNAYADAGDLKRALEQARWLQQKRGFAYTEQMCGFCVQALNVADSNLSVLSEAEILQTLGRHTEADKALERFDRRWPVESLPDHLRSRRANVSASKVGVL
jgi:tetratricopeptide (TPR) repeat protein